MTNSGTPPGALRGGDQASGARHSTIRRPGASPPRPSVRRTLPPTANPPQSISIGSHPPHSISIGSHPPPRPSVRRTPPPSANRPPPQYQHRITPTTTPISPEDTAPKCQPPP
eukprot:1093497-Prorocentrum_minimum.AAC.1